MIREKIHEKLTEWKLQNMTEATLLVLDSISYQMLIDELNDMNRDKPKIENLGFYADLSSIMMVCSIFIRESDKRFCGFARVVPTMFDL